MVNELKKFIEDCIDELVLEPTAQGFHALSREETAEFMIYMKILNKIDDLEQNNV